MWDGKHRVMPAKHHSAFSHVYIKPLPQAAIIYGYLFCTLMALCTLLRQGYELCSQEVSYSPNTKVRARTLDWILNF